MAFDDLTAEVTWYHFCHVLLVEDSGALLDLRGEDIDFMSYWKDCQTA